MSGAKPTAPEPIAIVGVGCRFPGADNPIQLWNLLESGGTSVGEIPEDRMGDLEEIFSPEPATPGKIMSRFGGYLADLDRMDAGFFGIAPREAELLDPQQRLLLEVAWEALEDAGQPVDALRGSSTGVYVGSWLQDFETRLLGDPTSADLSDIDFYTTTGSGRYNLSGRLSFFFGWQGPSVTLDTACSSSLVSIHLACNAIRGGECEVALAGGVNVILSPYITVAYSQSRMMAQDGKCKFGDASGDGYVRSEGCGLVVLKSLSAAQAAGDRIYAVIAGSAVNNDGRTSGFLATPGVEGQADLLRKAYSAAGVEPSAVGYVEAHGTGTAAGDPVELEAIGEVLGPGRDADAPCLVGSIKTNMGHTEGAAGIAGVIKAALSLHRGALPASLHHVTPNPKIDWDGWKLKVPTELQRWERGPGGRIAGVSGFGISGTNAHIVLRDLPSDPAAPDRPEPKLQLVPISASTQPALQQLAERWAGELAEADDDGGFLGHVRGAALRRSALDVRAGVLASNAKELRERLLAFADRPEGAEGVSTVEPGIRPGKIAFVFPGQGSQWLGMARQLLREEPAFRDSMNRIAEAMRDEMERPLLDLLADEQPIEAIDQVQPALFAIEIALADLWRSWGVEPDAVIGHSMGEAAAAAVAGALSLEDACKVICRRSRLMLRQSGKGLMTVVELTLDEAQEALAPYQGRLSVAVNNSPRSCVVSGEPEAMAELVSALEAKDIYCRAVKVDVASHSPQMDPLKADLLDALVDVRGCEGSVPVYSTVDGEPTDGAHFHGDYWVRNLRQPVLFAGMIGRLVEDGHTTFIEMSAHPILLPAVQQNLDAMDTPGLTLASMRRDEDERAVALGSLGRLFAAGFDLDWSRLIPEGGSWQSPPFYPWQRERFWYHDAGAISRPAAKSSAGRRRGDAHPDLVPLPQAIDRPGEWLFEVAAADLTDRATADGVVSQWEWLIAAGHGVASVQGIASGGELRDWKANLDAPRELDRVQIRVRRQGRKSFETKLLGAGQVLSTARWVSSEEPCSRRDDGRWLDRESLTAQLAKQVGQGDTAVSVDRLSPAKMTAVGLVSAPLPLDTRELAYTVDWAKEEGKGTRIRLAGRWIVLGPCSNSDAEGEVIGRLQGADAAAIQVDPSPEALTEALAEPADAILVVLDGSAPSGVDAAGMRAAEKVLEQIRPLRALSAALSRADSEHASQVPRIYVVGFAEPDHPSIAAAFAFAQVMNFEISGVRATAVELPAEPTEADWAGLIDELANDRLDRRVRLRDGERSVARLVRASSAVRETAPFATQEAPFAITAESLESSAPFVELAPLTPGSGELAVTVSACDWVGGNPAKIWGSVRELGSDVTEFQIGDAVHGMPQPVSGQLLASEVILDSNACASGTATGDAAAEMGSVSVLDFVDYGPGETDRVRIRFDRSPERLSMPASGVRPSATYWITGGLGGLGRGLADRWVTLGARHLLLTGRRDPGPEAQADLQRWQRLGVEVRTLRCDVADSDDVAEAFATIDAEMPPLAGIFHVAGVMDDALIADLDDDQYRKVFAPKVAGTTQLLHHLGNRPLDHFVSFSSAVCVIGGAGQANYVAANAYMDALIRRRHSLGRPALTLNWGPWDGVGLAAALSKERLESRGLGSLEPEAGWAVLEEWVNTASPQVVGMRFDATVWVDNHVAIQGDPFLAEWVRETEESADAPREDLLEQVQAAGSKVAQRNLLRDFVRRQVAAVLQADLNRIEPTRPFRALGFDSLMTLELRNRLEPPTGLKLSATMVWNYPNVHELADFLLGRLQGDADSSKASETEAQPEAAKSELDRQSVEEMSEDDAEALLAAKMAELENLT